jgi:hypothetical protein
MRMLCNILFIEHQVLQTDKQTGRYLSEQILFYFLPQFYYWEIVWCCYTFSEIDTIFYLLYV